MTAVRGLVDGFEGNFVTGWALDTANPTRACQIRVIDSVGEVIAKGLASRSRADLASVGVGHVNFAFRILLPILSKRERFEVTADNVSLLNSPIDVGTGLFDGNAQVRDGFVSGWVTERVTEFLPPHITVANQDGDVICEEVSRFEQGGSDWFRPARFRMKLPNNVFRNSLQCLTISANGTVISRCETNLRLVGYIDLVTHSRCAGWLYSPDAPQHPMNIEVWNNGKLVGNGACSVSRPDISNSYPDAISPGFDFSLKLKHLADNFYAGLSFRLTASDFDLFGGPFVAVTRPGAIALARRAAQLFRSLPDGEVGLGAAAIMRNVFLNELKSARSQDKLDLLKTRVLSPSKVNDIRLNVIVPVYRDVEVTRTCIQSVINFRNPSRDRLIVVNDRSPDKEMSGVLGYFESLPNVLVLNNVENLGFVRSVNKGLTACTSGHILLLNSDTQIFAGAFDELVSVLEADRAIATVTAMSNNATIFSYPHRTKPSIVLEDVSWEGLAAIALSRSKGLMIDVPTGHGFCMLIRREAFEEVGYLNEVFGRGYGEENEFCQRASDLGYKHVAACGVFVEHRESTSFKSEKVDLISRNLRILDGLYPEYTPVIMSYEERDPLRRARWPLDAYRLRQSSKSFLVIFETYLGGGSKKSSLELTELMNTAVECEVITVTCRSDGAVLVSLSDPLIQAQFEQNEAKSLFDLLGSANVCGAIVHQLLGFSQSFIEALAVWSTVTPVVFYLHDYYPICPRVTLIDAVHEFCNVPTTDVCERCVKMAGTHEASRLNELHPSQHRSMFESLLRRVTMIIAPNEDPIRHVQKAFPGLPVKVIPHPDLLPARPISLSHAQRSNFVLLGAIGEHKGSKIFLELARQARLHRPDLHFHVLGYTNCDHHFAKLDNVSITGPYNAEDLPELIESAQAQAALFLHTWPETFSYTLTEAAKYGLIPIVPDIGAPAYRVRQAQFGIVYPFPVSPKEVLDCLISFVEGRINYGSGNAMELIPNRNGLQIVTDLFARRRDAIAQQKSTAPV